MRTVFVIATAELSQHLTQVPLAEDPPGFILRRDFGVFVQARSIP